MATFTTKVLSGITATGATGGAIYITTGNTIALTAYGVVWATHTNPTKSDNYVNSGHGTGSSFNWISSLTGLLPHTKYATKGYFDYSGGTVYSGVEVSGTTLVALPTVTTAALTSITATGATGGGNVTNAGGGTITARGVAYSTSPNPTISGSHTSDGSGTGSFTSSITTLIPSTKYYVRAYATNSAGTAYGSQVTGKTISTVIHLTTLPVSGATNTTATSGGKVTGITGGTVTEVGVRVIAGGTGYTKFVGTYGGLNVPFIVPITGLLPNTNYSVIAYAVTTGNVTNTTFAETFITAPDAPHVKTIIQPVSPNETGSVIFNNLPNGNNILRWSGTTTGSTTNFTTGVTITGLTIGTYYFSIKSDFPNQPFSPITTITIKSPSVVPTEFTSTGYDLYYKTGIGDGPALAAYLVWLDEQSVIHEEP